MNKGPEERSQQVAWSREEHEETRQLLTTAFTLARALAVHTLAVQADELRDGHLELVEQLREDERLMWLVRDQEKLPITKRDLDIVLPIPDATRSRLSQLNLALFRAALEGHIEIDQRVLGLCGVTGSRRLDMLLIAKPARDFPWLQHHMHDRAMTRHLVRVLEIALRLAREGREGSSIGGIFVLGDPDTLSPYLRQLVLNPLQGHEPKMRNIHDPAFAETLRELSAIDGAFVVNRSGIVVSAGTYLDAPIGTGRLSPGLGTRHAAGRAITTVSDATAVIISSSSGTVIVYHDGEQILELERAQRGSWT